MSLEERMATFQFVYDDEGPHLNPSIMEMLKPEVGFGPLLLSGEAALPGGAGERLNERQDSTSADPKLQVRNVAPGETMHRLPGPTGSSLHTLSAPCPDCRSTRRICSGSTTEEEEKESAAASVSSHQDRAQKEEEGRRQHLRPHEEEETPTGPSSHGWSSVSRRRHWWRPSEETAKEKDAQRRGGGGERFLG